MDSQSLHLQNAQSGEQAAPRLLVGRWRGSSSGYGPASEGAPSPAPRRPLWTRGRDLGTRYVPLVRNPEFVRDARFVRDVPSVRGARLVRDAPPIHNAPSVSDAPSVSNAPLLAGALPGGGTPLASEALTALLDRVDSTLPALDLPIPSDGSSDFPATAPIRPDTRSRGQRALRIDHQLWALDRSEILVDRELALGLAQVWDSERYLSLGNVRAVDFVRERLGLKEGKARWLAKLGRGLRAVPELDAALSAGQLNASQVIELMRVIGSDTPAEERRAWTDRAAGLTVRALRAAIRAEADERRRSSGGQGASPALDSGDGPTQTISISNLERGLRPGLNILDLQASDDGDWLSVAVPARLGEIWSMSIDLARKVAGHHAPHHQCAEWIAADYLARVGDEDSEDTKRHEELYRRERCATALGRLMNGKRPRTSILDEIASGVTISVSSAPASGPGHAGSRAARWPDLSWTRPPLALGALERADDGADAWQLSAILEQLAARKRRLRLALGEHLERLRQTRSWEELGFTSFDEYCDERLGFGRRRAESLIRFDKLLRRYKRIRRAYLRGALSYTAAQKLLSVVHRSTERLWVEWAIGLSCRDIDRTVEYAAIFMLPGADPAVLRRYAQQLGAQSGAIIGMNGTGLGSPHGGASRSMPIANTFAAATGACCPSGNGSRTALGWPLPPTSIRGRPHIAGLEHAICDQPERLVARIRFFAPSDSLQVVRRAIRRCRQVLEQPDDPYRPDWCFLEVILVQFILEHDTPRTRRFLREHAIIARENFCCAIPNCSSRSQLQSHHMWMQSDQGPDDAWNQVALCKGHHDLVHAGVIELGGWAPWALYVRQGIDPRTGRALVCYKNGRMASEHEVRKSLAHWRSWCRGRRRAARSTRRPLEAERPEAKSRGVETLTRAAAELQPT